MTIALVLLVALGCAAVVSWRVGSRPREDVAPRADVSKTLAQLQAKRSGKTEKNQPQAPQTRGRAR